MIDDGRPTVAHVVLRFDKGGLEMAALNLCRQLRPLGFRSVVLALDGGGATADLARREGFEVIEMTGRRPLRLSFHRELIGHLRRLRPVVVHSSIWKSPSELPAEKIGRRPMWL